MDGVNGIVLCINIIKFFVEGLQEDVQCNSIIRTIHMLVLVYTKKKVNREAGEIHINRRVTGRVEGLRSSAGFLVRRRIFTVRTEECAGCGRLRPRVEFQSRERYVRYRRSYSLPATWPVATSSVALASKKAEEGKKQVGNKFDENDTRTQLLIVPKMSLSFPLHPLIRKRGQMKVFCFQQVFEENLAIISRFSKKTQLLILIQKN